jgi:hypothetical protein
MIVEVSQSRHFIYDIKKCVVSGLNKHAIKQFVHVTCSAQLTIANVELALISISVVEYELLPVEVAIFNFDRKL